MGAQHQTIAECDKTLAQLLQQHNGMQLIVVHQLDDGKVRGKRDAARAELLKRGLHLTFNEYGYINCIESPE